MYQNRDEIIKGLTCHAHIAHDCENCPYDIQRRRWLGGQGGPCDSFLADDALGLIAGQEGIAEE